MTPFNRESITPSYVKCNRTPSSREQQAIELAHALKRCKVKPTVVPGFAGIAPRPVRRDWVDPETRLKRKGMSREERQQARLIAELEAKVTAAVIPEWEK